MGAALPSELARVLLNVGELDGSLAVGGSSGCLARRRSKSRKEKEGEKKKKRKVGGGDGQLKKF